MKLDDAKKLHQKKYRTQLGYYLVEGEHLVLELQKAAKQNGQNFKNTQLYVTEEYQEWANALDADFKIFTISKKHMAQLSDTKTPQGIVACVPLPDLQEASPLSVNPQKYIYLHEAQDPGNLGTILRTLAWFGGFKLLLSPNSVDPFNPKVVRSSMGAIFHVRMELDVELTDLQNRFNSFAYLDMQGEKINTPKFAEFDCYLFGNEARGVPRDALAAFNATAFTIPGSGVIESLNLASAVNMCAYQLSL
ncbi:MAG: TrmH family RNA methyltransferase [Bermanella sp.]|jgi:TrmH family RNA methyltransferase